MSIEINQFARSHEALVEILADIKKIGFRNEEGQALLMENKSFILAHIKRANTDYYPILQKSAESIPQFTRVLTLFSVDMKLTTESVQQFFLHYQHYEHSLKYAAEYGRVYAQLSHCVQKENTVLAMLSRLMPATIDVQRTA